MIDIILWQLLGALSILIFWAIYHFLGRPIRVAGVALMSLRIFQNGLRQGQSVDEIIRGLAHSGDRHLARAWGPVSLDLLPGGALADRMREANLVAARVLSLVIVGQRSGRLLELLEARQRWLQDAQSRMWGGVNYIGLLPLLIVPAAATLLGFMSAVVVPKMDEVYMGLLDGIAEVPVLWTFVVAQREMISLVTALLWFFIIGVVIVYAFGETLALSDVADKLFPWRRKRVLRDFSESLAIFLDAGIDEASSIMLAAESTKNRRLIARARTVTERLAAGEPLGDALRGIDRSGELAWRIRTAGQSANGFQSALRGWHESLDARAFQQEQAVTQLVSTGFILVYGAMTALIVAGFFHVLTFVVTTMALW